MARLQNDNKSLVTKIKDLEEKFKSSEYRLVFTKQIVSDKEKELVNHKSLKEDYDSLVKENQSNEKKIVELNSKITTYKNDLK